MGWQALRNIVARDELVGVPNRAAPPLFRGWESRLNPASSGLDSVRRGCARRRFNLTNKTVAPLRHRFDVAWVSRVLAKGIPQAFHCGIDAVVELNGSAVGPKSGADFLA